MKSNISKGMTRQDYKALKILNQLEDGEGVWETPHEMLKTIADPIQPVAALANV